MAATVCLKVLYGPTKSYKLINFDGSLTCRDTVTEICQRYQVADSHLYTLYSPATDARASIWLEDTVILGNSGLEARDTIELKFKPYFAHFCMSDGTAQWMQGFTLSPTDRSILVTKLVDFSDPIKEYIPELLDDMHSKEEMCFQHIFEDDDRIKGKWLNSNRSFHEQDVPHNGFIALVPLSALLTKRVYDTDEAHVVVKEGFLTKLSIKTTKTTAPKKRWCVVKHNFLFYSASQTQSVPSGAVPLEYYDVHQDAKDKLEFTVRPTAASFSDDLPTYVFQTETETELREWMVCIMHRCTIGAGSMTFGVSLQKVMQRKLQWGILPAVITNTVKHLDAHGLDAQGLFRISGGALSINRFKDEFDRGLDVDLSKCPDIHVAAGLLKLYIRELPEPLVPFDMYDEFLMVDPLEERGKVVARLAVLCARLPTENMKVLEYLMPFLARVAANSEVNQMTVSNISIVFAPNILRPEEGAQGANLVQQTPIINKLMEVMIENHKEVLGMKSAGDSKRGERVSFRLGSSRLPVAPARNKTPSPAVPAVSIKLPEAAENQEAGEEKPVGRARFTAGVLPPVSQQKEDSNLKSPRTRCATPTSRRTNPVRAQDLKNRRMQLKASDGDGSPANHQGGSPPPAGKASPRQSVGMAGSPRKGSPGPTRAARPNSGPVTLQQLHQMIRREADARRQLEARVAELSQALEEERAARIALEEKLDRQ